MSPEQARGQELDARTDLFSFGVVLYEMATGQRPFQGNTSAVLFDAILNKTPTSPQQLNRGLPLELERIIDKALEKDREVRCQTAAELRADLKRLKRDLDSGRARAVSTTATAVLRPSQQRLVKRFAGIAVFVALALVISGVFWFVFFGPQHRPPANSPAAEPEPKGSAPALRSVPFTSYPGQESEPSFSPDGNYIAFAWRGEQDDNFDIYVKVIGTGTPHRLTTDPADDVSPVWSPDGRSIVFLRQWAGRREIIRVPFPSGPEQKLCSSSFGPPAGGSLGLLPGLTWSPDGRYLAFPDKASPQESYSIALISVEGLEKRKLTSPPTGYSDTTPAFAPNSQKLAFIRSGSVADDIYVIPIAGGDERRLTFDKRVIRGLAWTPEGREIVFSSQRKGWFNLWRIAVSEGTPELLVGVGEGAFQPSISRQGHLAYTQLFWNTNLWRMAMPGAAPGQGKLPTKLIYSTRLEQDAQYSPDGKRIAFASSRSGSFEIWVCDQEGLNPKPLTSFNGPWTGAPRWSPDGRNIAFDSRPEGHSAIYVISVEGGLPRCLTPEDAQNHVPSWSRDGKWIYFDSNRSGDWQVFRMPAEGGQAVQMTKQGGRCAFESFDGKWVYYYKGGERAGSIWKIPVEGGEETLVHERLTPHFWNAWNVQEQGIYFIQKETISAPPSKSATKYSIRFFSFPTSEVTEIAVLDKPCTSITISPDGHWILYRQEDHRDSDIMLVENFR
jgi:Tol biopolymer transport system component